MVIDSSAILAVLRAEPERHTFNEAAAGGCCHWHARHLFGLAPVSGAHGPGIEPEASFLLQ